MKKSVKTPLVTAVIVVLAAAAALAYVVLTGTALPWQPQEPPTQFLLIASAPDDTGATIAQIIALVDTSADTVTAVAPDTAATIAGTSYSEIKDALPFGGGAGVAKAYAQVTGAPEALSHIVIDASALAGQIDAQGGVTVEIPTATDVFDGEQLYTFKRGPASLSGAEFTALLKSRPYLTNAEQDRLDTALADALVHIAAGWTRDIGSSIKDHSLETDMTQDVVKLLLGSLGALAP